MWDVVSRVNIFISLSKVDWSWRGPTGDPCTLRQSPLANRAFCNFAIFCICSSCGSRLVSVKSYSNRLVALRSPKTKLIKHIVLCF